MTRDEFDEWLSDYCAAFPGIGKWIGEWPERTATNTLGHWFRALQHTSLADALGATEWITEGREDPIKAFDRDNTPVLIAKLAERVKASKTIVPKSGEWLPDFGGPKWSMLELFKAVLIGVRAGKTAAKLIAELVTEDDREQARRVRCLECLDDGTIEIWSNQSIRAAINGQEKIPLYKAVCRCNCVAGNRRTGLLFYNEKQMCRFKGFKDLQSLRDWSAEYEATRVERMPAYQDAFTTGKW